MASAGIKLVMNQEIARLRICAQLIANQRMTTAEAVVAHMVAMQAQDLTGAKWSIGLRLPDVIVSEIDNAIAEKKIIRTWPMRGTLHFVAAEDIHWMLALLASLTIARSARRNRELELNEKIFSKTGVIIRKSLEQHGILTKHEIYSILESHNEDTTNQRGIHIIQRHAMEGLICFGPQKEKQPTFVLLDDWAPCHKTLEHDDALKCLALRYFTSHGPATIKDFIWWSGLTAAEARQGLESVTTQLDTIKSNGGEYWYNPENANYAVKSPSVFLLPGYDEYILGYTRRGDVVNPEHARNITPGGGLFNSTIVIDGVVAGTWKRVGKTSKSTLELNPFFNFNKSIQKELKVAVERFLNYNQVGMYSENFSG